MKVDIRSVVGEVTDDIIKEIVSLAPAASNELKTASLEVLTGTRTGRVYRKPGGGFYTASAPGEPPAERTGKLRNSWQPVTSGLRGMNACIESTVPYGWLEYGSPGGKIAPRPYSDRIKERALPSILRLYDSLKGG